MAVFPRQISDRAIQFPRRYELTEVAPNVYDLTPVTGTVSTAGTYVNKALLQPIEDILGLSGLAPYEANDVELIYDTGVLIRVEETVSSTLRRKTQLNYTGEDLTSVVTTTYADNGTTVLQQVTDTLTYDLGALTNVTRVVNV